MFSLVAPLLAASAPSMYGVSMKSSLVTIDMTSGKMTELGTEHSEELEACSQMVAGGADPLAVAAYLYGVELDTGKLSGKKVPLCSMEPGPKTNPQQCPWSIELA